MLSQTRQARDVLKMATTAQSAVVRYVLNYNTLESISITICISILLCGMVRVPVTVVCWVCVCACPGW